MKMAGIGKFWRLLHDVLVPGDIEFLHGPQEIGQLRE